MTSSKLIPIALYIFVIVQIYHTYHRTSPLSHRARPATAQEISSPESNSSSHQQEEPISADQISNSNLQYEGHEVVILMVDNRFGDPNSYLTLTMAINQAYALKHGHRFVTCDIRDESLACPPDFCKPCCKLPCLQREMADYNKTKMVVFLDSDAIVHDFSMTFPDFTKQYIHNQTTITNGSDDHSITNTSAEIGTATKAPGTTYNSSYNYDLIIPTDCPNYQFNAGIMIWKNSPSAREFVDEWSNRTFGNKKNRLFPAEQGVLKRWYNEANSNIRSRLLAIPFGPDTWHVDDCNSRHYMPPRFVAHMTGRFQKFRTKIMIQTMQHLCGRYSDSSRKNHQGELYSASNNAVEKETIPPPYCLPILKLLANQTNLETFVTPNDAKKLFAQK